MARYFIRVLYMNTNEPWVDNELFTEAEANESVRKHGPQNMMELVPIKTDVRQVKQEVII